MPKAELHVHLEGSILPATLLQLARQRGIELPATDEASLAEWFQFRDFEHFVDIYLTCSRCLQHPEDFQLITRDFIAEQARQNVKYSEVHFTIGTHIANGGNGQEIRDALWQTLREGERDHGVVVRWIPDIVRNVSPEWADRTVEWALEGHGEGIVALGIAGIEKGFSNLPFRDHFAAIRAAGLHGVAHAGEHDGPASIRSALDDLGAERIGHGVRAVEDPKLVEELLHSKIPLEVCPTSNVCLDVFEDLASHSFDELYRAGIALSVNSDDPPLFATTLSEEYSKLSETFGYSPAQLARLSLDTVEQSFMSDEEKGRCRGEFRAEIQRLGEDLLDESLVLD
ncbi:MAG: adenosine deaminase [Thermoanaerobaculia bacterium]|nr:adenosine deaminase [Thermoanaerobaculia bacterium]